MADPVASSVTSGTSATATTTVSFSAQTAGTLLHLDFDGDDYITTTGAGRPESSGWTLIQNQNTGFQGQAAWYKVATGSETSVQYTIGSTAKSVYRLTAITNVDNTTPLNISNKQVTATSGGSYTTPSVTPTGSGRCIAVAAIAGSNSGNLFTASTAWTNSYTDIGTALTAATPGEFVSTAYLVLNRGTATSTGVTINGASAQSRSAIIAVYNGASTSPTTETMGVGSVAWSGTNVHDVVGTSELLTPAGVAWSGTTTVTVTGVTESMRTGSVAWSGTTTALALSVSESLKPGSVAWSGTKVTNINGVGAGMTPAAAAWSGTTATFSAAGSGTTHTGFVDAQGLTLTQSADGSAVTLATGFYASGRSDITAVGVRVYVPAGAGAGGSGFIGYLMDSSTGGQQPDRILATQSFGTVATNAWTSVTFSSAISMTDTKLYWVAVFFPGGEYGFDASGLFNSPVVFHDLSGVFYGSNSGDFGAGAGGSGNGSFGYGPAGTFPTNNASGDWFGVDAIVGGPDGTPASDNLTPGGVAWSGTTLTTSQLTPVTEPMTPGSVAWSGTKVTTSTVAVTTETMKPGFIAWGGTALGIDQITILVQGGGPPSIAWSGTNVTAGSINSAIEVMKPGPLAWSGTTTTTRLGSGVGVYPGMVAWAGTTFNSNAVVATTGMYLFTPPQRVQVNVMHRALRFKTYVSLTVYKINGVWVAEETPADDIISQADEYLAVSGRPELITARVAHELIAAGIGTCVPVLVDPFGTGSTGDDGTTN